MWTQGVGERHTWFSYLYLYLVFCVLYFVFFQFVFVFVSVEKNFVDSRVGEHRTLVFCCSWTQGMVSYILWYFAPYDLSC